MEIKVSKNIYNKKGLESAIRDYQEFAKIYFSETDTFFIIIIDGVDEELKDVIVDEFCNYLLFKTVKCL